LKNAENTNWELFWEDVSFQETLAQIWLSLNLYHSLFQSQSSHWQPKLFSF